MLSIVSIGGALPSQIVTNDFLKEVLVRWPDRPEDFPFDPVRASSPIISRATTLPLDFILRTGNREPFTTHLSALEKPTDLAFRATQGALARAGIEPAQIGLIIGDSGTPFESTPSEGQRLGKRLGLKVPAFDIWGGSCSFALHLSVLLARKPESVPPYVLCSSANVPSQSVCYGGHKDAQLYLAQFLFGDCAASWIVSYEVQGKLTVRDAAYCAEPGYSQQFYIDTYGFLALDPHFYSTRLFEAYEQAMRLACEKHAINSAQTKLAVSFSNPVAVQKLCERYGWRTENCWFSQSAAGESLGSSPAFAISEHWNELSSGDTILVLCAGAGVSYGYAVLDVR